MNISRLIRTTLVALALIVPSIAIAGDMGTLRITDVEGDVQVYSEHSGEWTPVPANMPLVEGDRLWVPTGARVELHLRGGTYARLDEETALDVLALEDGVARFYLDMGRLYLSDARRGVVELSVETPIASLDLHDGSKTMVDVSESGRTDISVIKGYAYATGRDDTQRVSAGRRLTIKPDGAFALARLGEPDEWELYNLDRDAEVFGSYDSARYLPEELAEYAPEFEGSGRWVYAGQYGYVWTPTLALGVGWAPYRHGKWTWLAGQYVWVSYEPWGWVPYHYGRWTSIATIGWAWVPPRHREVYWGPGYVSWEYTQSYVAWAPLAPGDIYVGYGYYGPYSRHASTYRAATRVSLNIFIDNSITIVLRDTFVNGRDYRRAGRHKSLRHARPFKLARRNAGPPMLKPGKWAKRPINRQVHASARPPERVRHAAAGKKKRETLLARTWSRPAPVKYISTKTDKKTWTEKLDEGRDARRKDTLSVRRGSLQEGTISAKPNGARRKISRRDDRRDSIATVSSRPRRDENTVALGARSGKARPSARSAEVRGRNQERYQQKHASATFLSSGKAKNNNKSRPVVDGRGARKVQKRDALRAAKGPSKKQLKATRGEGNRKAQRTVKVASAKSHKGQKARNPKDQKDDKGKKGQKGQKGKNKKAKNPRKDKKQLLSGFIPGLTK